VARQLKETTFPLWLPTVAEVFNIWESAVRQRILLNQSVQ